MLHVAVVVSCFEVPEVASLSGCLKYLEWNVCFFQVTVVKGCVDSSLRLVSVHVVCQSRPMLCSSS